MPCAFSPNNDRQNDRYWSPDIDRVQLVQLMIVNRRGQVVYKTTSPVPWDGSVNGNPAGQDTYNYFIRYICDDEEMEKKGTL
ncbi:MAG: gliding motility-associated C-terminal domain-containing protein, partial [Taibaiella sp.]|nr:gliding motility-associated C-terminal domain-containing protein [Taibaiella sp.]